ncbi:helix-turn-helix domain-containing protein [Muricauda sp. CAU 1633]|uniref:AraC family transcriptional regulator n=1 Tax=Allomuricauda sp. CAU 1633 TaxID=2816036 RepID=UPI001A907F6D|nr:AraC family transcriptional regulator [Muricauda sp. CAU 1633]MBO0321506.1 helix-turn-helix domain-containing protein [Muricauda sp. CAU 1633]
MKILPFKIPKPEQEALVYQEDSGLLFYDKLHQHEEIQISYIVSGEGSIVVGDTISDFKANDILVIGENVPHVFRSDSKASSKSVMYTLFFTKESFGKEFFSLSDMTRLHNFFEESGYGMKILSENQRLSLLFENLKNQSRIQRIATLLNILDVMISSEKQPLSTFVYRKKYTEDEGNRMNNVIDYALSNFHEPFSLEMVAEKASMSKNAFCRYFKKRTNKTFFQFLIEIRIEHACRLLFKDNDLPISEVSEQCGFLNIANFNRKFKELKGVTPTQYRKFTIEKWRDKYSKSA